MTRRQHRGETHTPDGRQPGTTGISTGPDTLPALIRSTGHPGRKRWFSHRPSPAHDIQLSKAHTWSVVTGRPLPPAARIRTDRVSNAVPMTDAKRLDYYQLWNRADHTTTAQSQRRRHKLGRQLAGLKTGSAEHEQLADAYLALRPDGTAG